MDVSAAALLLRLVVSLGIVLGLMMAAAAVLRRRAVPGVGPRRRPVPIEVVGRQGLGRSASVAIVRAGGRALVLGITDNAVNVLAEADLDVLDEAPEGHGTALPGGASRSSQTWMALLDSLRERTVRKA